MKADRDLADAIETLWKEVGDGFWMRDAEFSTQIFFHDGDGRSIGGFSLRDCPNAEKRVELIAKTINSIPRILEILRR